MAQMSKTCALTLGVLAALVLLPGPAPQAHPPSGVAPSSGLQMQPAPVAASLPDAALSATGAPLWHLVGLRGQGVRVGIIDRGFGGYTTLVGVALPEQVVARNFVAGESEAHLDSGSPHGAAVAEIVHRMAPGAALYLAKIGVPDDLAQAVAWLLDEASVDLILTSFAWYGLSPGDGTGAMADLVAHARSQGVMWITPAGDARLLHWSGDWRDDNHDAILDIAPMEDRLWLTYQGGYLLPSGLEIEVAMRWSDWVQVDQDLDIYLFRGDTIQEIAWGDAPQSGLGTHTPTERFHGLTYGADRVYGLYVRRQSGDRPVHVDLFVSGVSALSHRDESQSLADLADAPAGLSVSAIASHAPYAQAPYSSQGPTKGPGGVAQGGAAKPDLAAYAGVTTVSLGVLEGTAAAAAHVAGAAALVLGAHPYHDPEQVYALLLQRALDLGTPGWDPIYGQGRLYLGDPPLAPLVQRWLPIGAR